MDHEKHWKQNKECGSRRFAKRQSSSGYLRTHANSEAGLYTRLLQGNPFVLVLATTCQGTSWKPCSLQFVCKGSSQRLAVWPLTPWPKRRRPGSDCRHNKGLMRTSCAPWQGGGVSAASAPPRPQGCPRHRRRTPEVAEGLQRECLTMRHRCAPKPTVCGARAALWCCRPGLIPASRPRRCNRIQSSPSASRRRTTTCAFPLRSRRSGTG